MYQIDQHIKDIKQSAYVALLFVVALTLLWFANQKFDFSSVLVDFTVKHLFG